MHNRARIACMDRHEHDMEAGGIKEELQGQVLGFNEVGDSRMRSKAYIKLGMGDNEKSDSRHGVSVDGKILVKCKRVEQLSWEEGSRQHEEGGLWANHIRIKEA